MKFPLSAISIAALIAAMSVHAAEQGYAVKIPITKLVSEQGTAIEVTPSPAVFSSPTALGSLAGPITVQVRNAGFSPITSIVPTLTDGGADFTLKNDCPITLGGMASCTLTLDFKPTAVGARLGNLAVSSSAKNGLQLVPISGTGMAPDATLTPGSFSDTQIRETSTGTLVLANTSAAALRLTPAPLTGDFSLAGGSCGATLAAGASCNYSVDFKPTTAGAKTATFKVTLGVGSYSFERTAALAGTAQAPAGTLGAIDFGAVPAGQGATRDATVTNTGAGPLTLGAPTASGAGFSIASGGSCGATLAKGESCTVKVQLLPAGTTAHTGTLTVPVQDAAALTASLAGQSQQAVLSLIRGGRPFTSGLISLGAHPVGTSYTDRAISITNTGNTAATGLSLTAASPFGVAVGSCTGSLAAGSQCSFQPTFSPALAQDYTGTLSIQSANAATQLVTLTGTGSQSKAVLASAGTLNLADWYQAGPITGGFTYRNDGNAAMTLASPTLASPLSVAGNSCTDVAPGASCDITVALTRNANPGGSGSQSFTPSGAGVAPAQATASWAIYSLISSWSATSLNFGSVSVGQSSTKSLTLTNSGSVAGNTGFGLVNLPPAYSADLSNCSNLTPGGSCIVSITFTPPDDATHSGSSIYPAGVSITNNTLSVTGKGMLQSIATLTSASTLSLADWYQSGSIAGAYTYRNDGNAPLTLTSPTLASPLSVASNSCSGVAPGASCDITVALTRDANPGGSGSQSFTPSGAGTAPAQTTASWAIYSVIPSWDTDTVDFGSLIAGSNNYRSVTLTNSGSVVADWSNNADVTPNLGGTGFSLGTSGCSNVAPNGGSCAVSVMFSPTAAGNYEICNVTMAYASRIGGTLCLKGVATNATYGPQQFTSAIVGGTAKFTVTNLTGRSLQVSALPPTKGSVASVTNSWGASAVYPMTTQWDPGTALTISSGGTAVTMGLDIKNGQVLTVDYKLSPRSVTHTIN